MAGKKAAEVTTTYGGPYFSQTAVTLPDGDFKMRALKVEKVGRSHMVVKAGAAPSVSNYKEHCDTQRERFGALLPLAAHVVWHFVQITLFWAVDMAQTGYRLECKPVSAKSSR